jgi:hypothetical protein
VDFAQGRGEDLKKKLPIGSQKKEHCFQPDADQ